ncbi:MAG: acyltransferase family protein, partial [Planctomycetia bacterium]
FRRRLARVVPLYVALVVASHLLHQYRGNPWPLYNLEALATTNLWTHLLFIRGTSVFWTIPVEVQFYAVFPLIWLLYRWQGWTAALWLMLAIVVMAASGFARVIELVPYATFFLSGCIAAMLPKPATTKGLNTIFVVCCILYVATFPRIAALIGINTTGVWLSPLYMLLIPVFLLASLHAPLAQRLLANSVARFFGNISYSVYLLHLPILLLLPSKSPTIWNLCLYTVLTTVVSWLSFVILETPSRAWNAEGKNPVTSLLEGLAKLVPATHRAEKPHDPRAVAT